MIKRVEKLRDSLKDSQVDGIMITKPENWQYLSGFTGSNAILLITLNACVLITDFRYMEQARNQTKGYTIIRAAGAMPDAVSDQLSSLDVTRLGFEDDSVTFYEHDLYRKQLANIELIPLHQVVEQIRWVKDAEEISLLKRAAQITDMAFDHVINKIKPGVTETEIALEIEYFMRKNGAQKAAFDTIVASGPRAALPHGVASDRKITAGDFVVLDFGAVYEGYHADMTRTVVVGKPDKQQEKIYDIVFRAQEKALKAIKPGLHCKDVDMIARELITQEGYGPNFGHGLGHSVGLEIHERPSLSPRDDAVLEQGMAVTVEPGIYLDGWGGVRIEDLVVVTSGGCEVLSHSPKELIVL